MPGPRQSIQGEPVASPDYTSAAFHGVWLTFQREAPLFRSCACKCQGLAPSHSPSALIPDVRPAWLPPDRPGIISLAL